MTAQRLVVACPHCSTKLAVAPSSQGQTLRCGKCKKAFRLAPAAPVAGPTQAQAPPATAPLAAPAPQTPTSVPGPNTPTPTLTKPPLPLAKAASAVVLTILFLGFVTWWSGEETDVAERPTKKVPVPQKVKQDEKPKWNRAEMVKDTMCSSVIDAGDGLCRVEYDFRRYPDRALFVPAKKIKAVESECELVIDDNGHSAVMAVTSLRDEFSVEMDFTLDAPDGVFELAIALPLETRYGNSREFMYRSSGKKAGAYLAVTKFTRKSRLELARLVVKRAPYVRQGIVQQFRMKTEKGQMPYITIDGAPIRWLEPTDDFKNVDPGKFSRAHLRIRVVQAKSLRIHRLVVEAKPSEVAREGNPRWESSSKHLSSRSSYSQLPAKKRKPSRPSPTGRKSPTRAGRRNRRKAKTRGSASK